jgi:hypothetical protein
VFEVNEQHTVIDFDDRGRRTFTTRLVTLQATGEIDEIISAAATADCDDLGSPHTLRTN